MSGTALVFHLAAQIAIPYSYINPRDFFETNVLGSLNVAQSALDAEVEHLIHVFDQRGLRLRAVNSDHRGSPARGPITLFGKQGGRGTFMDSYHRTYALPVTVVRPFNTYGPHQSARAIVPTIISQALASDILRLGSLEPRRDLTYVNDTAAGFIAAAASSATVGRTIQLGTGHDVSVGEIVEMVAELLGKELAVEQESQRVRPPNSEVQRLLSNPALAKELMGWQPQVTLREGLAHTLDWIAANTHRYRTDEYVV